MAFRRTIGIVTPGAEADPRIDADYIISAAILGFAVERLTSGADVQFDMASLAEGEDPVAWTAEFHDLQEAAARIGDLAAKVVGGQTGHTVAAGTAVDHTRGAVVVGVYGLAGQKPPTKEDIRHPEGELSAKGKLLYEKITSEDTNPGFQYIGRGAYTGFVDNHNVEGDTDPVGPLSTVRFAIPDFPAGGTAGETSEGWHPRWLPPSGAEVWKPRLRRDTLDDHVDWGLIGGDLATKPPSTAEANPTEATNRADQITGIMRDLQGMTFLDDAQTGTTHGYTHGMIQAIYQAYDLGPSCTPYEITVGQQTTKLASCFACTVFMTANGYPPSSTHIGAAESWAPLYAPFDGPHEVHPHHVPSQVLRDLNGSLAEYCDRILRLGATVLDVLVIPKAYLPARTALISALGAQYSVADRVAVSLFLDALTVHDKEMKRVRRVLGLD